jgi:O-methyltransferase domain/Dimerisation domain
MTDIKMPGCDDKLIWNTWMSMFNFPALTVAAELGLFSLLHKNPASSDVVAKEFGFELRAAEALLGILTSLGYLIQRDKKFYLTDVSQYYLIPESPYYWGGMLKLMSNFPLHHSILMEALKKYDSNANDSWRTTEPNSEMIKMFTSAMHSMTKPAALSAAQLGNFSSVKRLLDIGGGSAAMSIAIAQQYPDIHCTIMELPAVAPQTEQYITNAGLTNQIDILKGDFFKDSLPKDYDAFLFSHVLEDWKEEKCLFLLKCSFEALPSGGQIYIHEPILAETKDSPAVSVGFAMCMVWWSEGKVLTISEITQLLQTVGFEDISVTPTHGHICLITARKP